MFDRKVAFLSFLKDFLLVHFCLHSIKKRKKRFKYLYLTGYTNIWVLKKLLFVVLYLLCLVCFALLFIRMFQDYAAAVKVFIHFVLFRITSYFSRGDFTILTPFSTTLLVKYECLLFATAVTPLM